MKTRKKSQRQNEKREHTELGLERRASRLPCLNLGDDRQGMPGSKDISQTIFITSMSGSESFTFFTDRFFHFSRPLCLRLVFDAAERNEKFGPIQCQRSKESSRRGKRKRLVFLCRKKVRVKVKIKVISMSFLKIEGRGDVCGSKRPERETVSKIGR